jgi:hypothetical protein
MIKQKSKLNLKIYVANLRAYNEGTLVGKWINLPITNAELQQEMEYFGDCDWAIHDSYSNIKISEFTDIYEFNEFLNTLIELNNDLTLNDLELIYRFFNCDIDIMRIVENGYTIIDGIGNYYDLAKLCLINEEYYHILPFDMYSFLDTGINTSFLCEQQISQEMTIDENIYIDKEKRKVLYTF